MRCDGGIDQVAAQGPEPGEDAILIRARKPRIADDVGHQVMSAERSSIQHRCAPRRW
jgi:hypothetical protein